MIKKVTLSYTATDYTGKEQSPRVTVTDSEDATIGSNYYTTTFSNNINVGVAKAVVTFQGNYSGTVTKKYTIRPMGTTLTGVNNYVPSYSKAQINIKAMRYYGMFEQQLVDIEVSFPPLKEVSEEDQGISGRVQQKA